MTDPAMKTGTSHVYLEIARDYSSTKLMGPPMSDDLVALVMHMYDEEEADLVRNLRPLRARTAAWLAERAGRPLEEVEPILRRLALEKYVLLTVGEGSKQRFSLMPVVPGTFESVLMKPHEEDVTEWHRRFAELFEAVFNTGYMTDYVIKPTNFIRYLPVGEVIETIPSAWPSDRLEEILEKYKKFAIGSCQCRLSMKLTGGGCGRMIETCTTFGSAADMVVSTGRMRRASRRDVIDVKRAAESEGLVTWMFNVDKSTALNGSCSCCGCCCGALRSVSQFNSPGLIAPPHFMPSVCAPACVYCEKCVKVCPMGAFAIAGEGDSKRLVHRSARCIGCGLCVIACKKGALSLKETPGYRHPPSGWITYLLKYLPASFSNIHAVSAKRKRQ